MSSQGPTRVAHWSLRGAIFTGYTVNGDVGSKATLAISLQIDGYVNTLFRYHSGYKLHREFSVKVFHVVQGLDTTYTFQEMYSVATDMKPITLLGDVLALDDSRSRTTLWNWKEGTYATLRDSTGEASYIQVRFSD
jgi:hypothetical protein